MVVQTLFSVNTDNLRNIFHQKKTLFQIIISYHLVKIRKSFLAPSSVSPVKTFDSKGPGQETMDVAVLGPQNITRPWTFVFGSQRVTLIALELNLSYLNHLNSTWIWPIFSVISTVFRWVFNLSEQCYNNDKNSSIKKVTFVNQSEPVSEPDSWFTSNILDQERLTVTPI